MEVHVMTDTPPAAATPSQPRPTPSEHTEGSSRPPSARTRLSGTWVAVIVAAIVFVLLLIFILQNTESVDVSYFGVHGTMPLGVALLLAAIGGILLAALVASLRIWQLRHRLRNQGK
jgi:putative membrane protein